MSAAHRLSDTLHRLGSGLIDSAQGRLTLLQAELAAQLDHIGALLARQLLLTLSLHLTAQLVALVVLAGVWDTRWRLPAALLLAALSAAGTVLAYRAYQAQKDKATPVFAATLGELEKDRAIFERRG